MRDIKVGDTIGMGCKVLQIKGGPGKSGMGIVYICYNSFWKKKIAVKTIQKRFFSSLDVVNAFKLEALAWKNLEMHPYIVYAHEVHEIYGRTFLYLDYIAPDKLGRNTLTHYLKTPITLNLALIWGIEFCHAMEHSILHGVTPHRDIKPDNIMITDNFNVKVTDFGLAKLWNQSNIFEAQLSNTKKDLTVENLDHMTLFKGPNNINIAGTPPWMAPEQFEGVTNIRSDIYSFGVVLFQMVNRGKLPFIANSVDGFKEAHQKHALPQFDSKLFPFIKKCLAKSPEDRYLNFKELRLDLEDLYRRENGEDLNLDIEIKDLDALNYLTQGVSFFSLGLYDEAIQACNKALTLTPGDIEHEILNYLGLAYHRKGSYDKAIDAFTRSIKLSPEFEAPYNNLASAYSDKAKTTNDPSLFHNIKKLLNKLLELNPNQVDGLHSLALYYSDHENDNNKAVELFERCIELNPDDPLIYVNLGSIYREMGMFDKTIVLLKKALQINPLHVDNLKGLAFLFISQEMHEKAIPIIQKIISINPKDPKTLKLLELNQKIISLKKLRGPIISNNYKKKKKKKKKKGKDNKKR